MCEADIDGRDRRPIAEDAGKGRRTRLVHYGEVGGKSAPRSSATRMALARTRALSVTGVPIGGGVTLERYRAEVPCVLIDSYRRSIDRDLRKRSGTGVIATLRRRRRRRFLKRIEICSSRLSGNVSLWVNCAQSSSLFNLI